MPSGLDEGPASAESHFATRHPCRLQPSCQLSPVSSRAPQDRHECAATLNAARCLGDQRGISLGTLGETPSRRHIVAIGKTA
jgi:hypothetical protein